VHSRWWDEDGAPWLKWSATVHNAVQTETFPFRRRKQLEAVRQLDAHVCCEWAMT
jgi:hypothetical protein